MKPADVVLYMNNQPLQDALSTILRDYHYDY